MKALWLKIVLISIPAQLAASGIHAGTDQLDIAQCRIEVARLGLPVKLEGHPLSAYFQIRQLGTSRKPVKIYESSSVKFTTHLAEPLLTGKELPLTSDTPAALIVMPGDSPNISMYPLQVFQNLKAELEARNPRFMPVFYEAIRKLHAQISQFEFYDEMPEEVGAFLDRTPLLNSPAVQRILNDISTGEEAQALALSALKKKMGLPLDAKIKIFTQASELSGSKGRKNLESLAREKSIGILILKSEEENNVFLFIPTHRQLASEIPKVRVPSLESLLGLNTSRNGPEGSRRPTLLEVLDRSPTKPAPKQKVEAPKRTIEEFPKKVQVSYDDALLKALDFAEFLNLNIDESKLNEKAEELNDKLRHLVAILDELSTGDRALLINDIKTDGSIKSNLIRLFYGASKLEKNLKRKLYAAMEDFCAVFQISEIIPREIESSSQEETKTIAEKFFSHIPVADQTVLKDHMITPEETLKDLDNKHAKKMAYIAKAVASSSNIPQTLTQITSAQFSSPHGPIYFVINDGIRLHFAKTKTNKIVFLGSTSNNRSRSDTTEMISILKEHL